MKNKLKLLEIPENGNIETEDFQIFENLYDAI